MRNIGKPEAILLCAAFLSAQVLSLAQASAGNADMAAATVDSTAASSASDPRAKVLAKVGDGAITVGDLLDFLAKDPQLYGRAGSREGRVAILKQMIENRLIRLAAEERMAAEDRSDYETENAPERQSAAWENRLKEAVKKLVTTAFTADAISEEDLHTAYQARKGRLGIPESVRIREIFFPVPEDADEQTKAAILAEAEEVLAQIRGGTPLKKLAREKAHTPELRLLAGDHGFIPLADYPYLQKATIGMDVGAVSQVIQLAGGYQIFQLLGRQDGIPPPYDQVKEELRRQLQSESAVRKKDRFLKEFSQKIGVTIEEPGLQAAWPNTTHDH